MQGPNLPEEEIRSRARKAVDEGRLPVLLAKKISAGSGSGMP
jgi:hypothetical protein